MNKDTNKKTLLAKQKLLIIILGALAAILAVVYTVILLTSKQEQQKIAAFYNNGVFTNAKGDAVEVYVVDTLESRSLTADVVAMLEGEKKNDWDVQSTADGIVFHKDNVKISTFPYIFPEIQRADLARVIVTNSFGTFSVFNSGGDFFVAGAESNLYNSQQLSELVLQARYMLSNGYVEDASDPAQFGLTEETCSAKISIFDVNGNNYTVYLGDAAVNDNQFYMKRDDKDEVYVMDSSASVFFNDVRSYLNPVVVKPIEEQQRNYIETFALVKNGQPFFACEIIPEEERKGVYINQLHKMTYPEVEFVLDTVNLYEMFGLVGGLSGTQVVEYGVSKSENKAELLSQYGLDNTTADIGFTYGGNSYVVSVGSLVADESSAYYYVYSEYQDTIVLVPYANLAFLELELSDLYQSNVFQYSINEVEEVEVKNGKNVYNFLLHGTGDSLSVSEKNLSKQVDTPSFRQFYISLLSVSIGGYSSIEGASADNLKHELTFTVKLRNGARLTYDFYSESTTSCYMIVDGKGGFKTDRSRIEKIAKQAQMLVDGEIIESFI